MQDYPIPSMVDNTPVGHGKRIITIGDKRYITLWPDNEDDSRLWEFCLDDGRIILTCE